MFPLSLRAAVAIGGAPGDSTALAVTENGHDGRIAQLVEQLTLNQRVVGSSPTASTKLFKHLGENLPTFGPSSLYWGNVGVTDRQNCRSKHFLSRPFPVYTAGRSRRTILVMYADITDMFWTLEDIVVKKLSLGSRTWVFSANSVYSAHFVKTGHSFR